MFAPPIYTDSHPKVQNKNVRMARVRAVDRMAHLRHG
jgi:hypothetical protein